MFEKISAAEKFSDLQIRRERPEDYRETENLTREAFWNHYSSGYDEHYLIHIMRDCSAFVPELAHVAVHEGKIVGNIAYTKAIIKADDTKDYEVLCLGPISVLPEYQRKGVGGELIEHTKRLACNMGFSAILLYGDPDYYSRHGFVPAEGLGIRTADNMYATALQVCELYENSLSGVKMRFFEDQIYEVDENAAIKFDESFPVKEKVSDTPSQRRFQELVLMRRSAD